MNDSREPRRLLRADDPAFAELVPGLHEARAQAPSAEQVARMRAALGLPTAPGPDPARAQSGSQPDATRTAHRAGSTPAWLKLVIGGALALAVLAGLQRWLPRAEPAPPPRPSAGAAIAEAAPPASDPQAMPQPDPVAAAAEPAAAAKTAPQARPSVTAPRRPRSAADPSASEQPSSDADAAAELALLRAAKAHARSAPERALALLAEHAQRFEHGAMAQEREVIAVEALLAAGDRARAERRAQAFIARYPDSAHVRRVRALLATDADSDTKPTRRPDSSH